MLQEKKKEYEPQTTAAGVGYTEGERTAAARAELDALKKPEAYTSKWQTQLDDTVGKILNREKFSYNVNGDALYKQYKDQYTKLGKAAMDDTIARASAMTGGYGNSYAATAGNQAYQGYLSQLNDVIPELYQMAYDRYNAEGEALKDDYALLSDAENAEYGRHRDKVSDYLTERDYLQGVYENERGFDYQQGRDAIEDDRYADETAYSREQDAKAWQYQQDRDAIEDERYADETAYSREQDAKAWQYQQDRDAIEDERYADETAYSREQDAYNKSVDEALMAAQYGGDFSGLAKLYGIDEETARTLWYAQSSGGDEIDETLKYGGYTKKEFTDKISEYAQMDDEEMAKKFADAAGTPEAQSVYESFFGGTEPNEYAERLKTYDYDSKDTLLTKDQWTLAKNAGNTSEVIAGYDTYEKYKADFDAYMFAKRADMPINPIMTDGIVDDTWAKQHKKK